jgi:hypothetical protein
VIHARVETVCIDAADRRSKIEQSRMSVGRWIMLPLFAVRHHHLLFVERGCRIIHHCNVLMCGRRALRGRSHKLAGLMVYVMTLHASGGRRTAPKRAFTESGWGRCSMDWHLPLSIKIRQVPCMRSGECLDGLFGMLSKVNGKICVKYAARQPVTDRRPQQSPGFV